MSEPIYLIYKHTSPSGKSYIGQTTDLKRRNQQHKHPNNECINFRNAIQKYGWDNFIHEILFENLTLDEANKLEEQLIKEHNTMSPFGYNLKFGGNNRTLLESTKLKISKNSARRGIPLSPEHKQKLLIVNTGKTISTEHKQKLSIARKGQPSNKKGSTWIKDTITGKRLYFYPK